MSTHRISGTGSVSVGETADATVTHQAGGFLGDRKRLAVFRCAHIHQEEVEMASAHAPPPNMVAQKSTKSPAQQAPAQNSLYWPDKRMSRHLEVAENALAADSEGLLYPGEWGYPIAYVVV